MTLSPHDQQRLLGVHPVLIAAIEDIFTHMAQAGAPMFVIGGVRTPEQQGALYAQGRTAPGKIVTYCDGVTKKSDHETELDGYGHAVDCAFLPTKDKPDPWGSYWPWTMFERIVIDAGSQAGGNFKQPADLDHVQYVAKGTVSP